MSTNDPSSRRLPPPLPAGSLYEFSSRSPVLTAVGVISIVVGGLSILASAIAVLCTLLAMFVASITSGTAASHPPLRFAAVTTHGLDDSARGQTINALQRVQPLTTSQHDSLDQLLAKAGRDIFPFVSPSSPDALSSKVRQAVTSSGLRQLAAPDGSSTSITYFSLNSGRVEIDDQHALFIPLDGTETSAITRGASEQPEAAITMLPPIAASSGTLYHAQLTTGLLMVVTESALSIAAGIFLIVAGVKMLRDRASARRLHLIYAIVKLPLVGSFTFAALYLLRAAEQRSRMAGASVPSALATSALPFAPGYALVVCVAITAAMYPIALLIVLNMRAARNYARSLR